MYDCDNYTRLTEDPVSSATALPIAGVGPIIILITVHRVLLLSFSWCSDDVGPFPLHVQQGNRV